MDTSTPQTPVPTPAVPVQTGASSDTRTIVTVNILQRQHQSIDTFILILRRYPE